MKEIRKYKKEALEAFYISVDVDLHKWKAVSHMTYESPDYNGSYYTLGLNNSLELKLYGNGSEETIKWCSFHDFSFFGLLKLPLYFQKLRKRDKIINLKNCMSGVDNSFLKRYEKLKNLDKVSKK